MGAALFVLCVEKESVPYDFFKTADLVLTRAPSSQEALQGLHSDHVVALHSGSGVTEQSSPSSPMQ